MVRLRQVVRRLMKASVRRFNPTVVRLRRGTGWVFAKRVVQGRSGKSAQWIKEGGKIRKPFLEPAFEWAKKNLVEFFKKAVEREVRKG